MLISTQYNNNYHIDEFRTAYDPNNERKNKYVDIKYSEIEVSFNQNKIVFEITAHVANNFYLPQNSIKMNLIFPGVNIENISLLNTYTDVDNSFLYGYPDASQVFKSKVILDMNEDEFINSQPNYKFDVNTSFHLDVNQLEGLQIDGDKVNKVITDLNNINLHFSLNFSEDNKLNFENQYIKEFNHNYRYKLISSRQTTENIVLDPIQENILERYSIQIPTYKTQNGLELFSVIKQFQNPITINVKDIQIKYFKDNKWLETNKLEINDIFNFDQYVFSYIQNNIKVIEKDNGFELIKSSKGLEWNVLNKLIYTLNIEILLNGRWIDYQLINSFDFQINKDPKIVYEQLSKTELEIDENDKYYQIIQN